MSFLLTQGFYMGVALQDLTAGGELSLFAYTGMISVTQVGHRLVPPFL